MALLEDDLLFNLQRDFDRAKTAVLELKGALHAFLDQEMQDAQEKKLAEVAQSAIEVSAKLDTMDAQLSEIREKLAAANKKDPTTAQLDEESLIYAQIQQASDRTGDLPFKSSCLPLKCSSLTTKISTRRRSAHSNRLGQGEHGRGE